MPSLEQKFLQSFRLRTVTINFLYYNLFLQSYPAGKKLSQISLRVKEDGNETSTGRGQAQSGQGLLLIWTFFFMAWAFSANNKVWIAYYQTAFSIKKRITWNYAEGMQNILALYFLSLCIRISPHDTFKRQQMEKSGLEIWC